MVDRPVIDAALVARIAALAQIDLGAAEQTALAAELEKILDYVETLEALEVDEVEARAHGVDPQGAWRADEVVPGLGAELALREAPEPILQGFGVPRVIE